MAKKRMTHHAKRSERMRNLVDAYCTRFRLTEISRFDMRCFGLAVEQLVARQARRRARAALNVDAVRKAGH